MLVVDNLDDGSKLAAFRVVVVDEDDTADLHKRPLRTVNVEIAHCDYCGRQSVSGRRRRGLRMVMVMGRWNEWKSLGKWVKTERYCAYRNFKCWIEVSTES